MDRERKSSSKKKREKMTKLLVSLAILVSAGLGACVGMRYKGSLENTPARVWESPEAAIREGVMPEHSGKHLGVEISNGWQIGRNGSEAYLTWRLERYDSVGTPVIYTSVSEWDGARYKTPKFGVMIMLYRKDGRLVGWGPVSKGGTDSIDYTYSGKYFSVNGRGVHHTLPAYLAVPPASPGM